MSYLNPISLLFDNLEPVSTTKVLENAESAAAVLIALTENKDNPEIIFTRRADHLNSHRGQVSFPGGRWEPEDQNLVQTAIRESQEEIDLDPAVIRIKGSLEPRLSINNLDVYPFVAEVPENIALSANPDEIADIFSVPIRFFIEEKPARIDCLQRGGKERRVPAWKYMGFEIWGLTALFTYDLLTRSQLDLDFTGVQVRKYER